MANTVLFANNDVTTLAGAITSTALTANLSPGSGVLFPHPTTGQYFPMTFQDAATGLLREIVYVTNVTGDVITMIRAQESTTALAWNSGDTAGNLLTAGTMNLLVQQSQSQNNSYNYAADTGTANSYTVSYTPSVATPSVGTVYYFSTTNANTGASTLSLNGGTAYSIVAYNGTSLVSGAISSGSFCAVRFNGTTFTLVYATNGLVQENVATAPAGDVSQAAASTAFTNTLLNGQSNISTTGGNTTLSASQYGQYILNVTGTLTSNATIFLPASTATWQVYNGTTGSFSLNFSVVGTPGSSLTILPGITATIWSDGTNIRNGNTLISSVSPIQSISAVPSSNTLVCGYAAGTLQFRSATLTNGAPTTLAIGALILTIPTGATLGSVNAVQSQFVYAVAYNSGTPLLCVANISGGLDMSETGLISTTAISSGATSAATWYSASAITNSPYRIVGTSFQTEATAGTYATAPTLVQGQGGLALAALQSIGYGQIWTDLTSSRVAGTTYFNTTSRPIFILVNITLTGGSYSTSLTVNGTIIGSVAIGVNQSCLLPALISPGESYSVSISSGSITRWFEKR